MACGLLVLWMRPTNAGTAGRVTRRLLRIVRYRAALDDEERLSLEYARLMEGLSA